ncbi:MAG: hypothetical protein GXO85_02225 [Chlorobi bacterium]|nr:hypothetical protein [Chlorobiota bacterium]
MMDSISPYEHIEFARKYYINKGTYENVTADGTGAYTIQGVAIPCFQLTGTSECWLINVLRQRNTYAYGVVNGDNIENSDYALIAVKIRGEFASQLRRPRSDYSIPLNYPYTNTQWDADRLERDIIEYFECKKICYWSVTANVAARSLGLSITIMEYVITDVVYATNLVVPYPDSAYFVDGGSLTTGANTQCGGIAEVFRKEQNGAILYYIDDLGTLNAPPLPGAGASKKVNCNYIVNERDDCDRLGSQECWIAPAENEVCSYYLQINNLDTLFGVYINGTNVLSANVHPNLGRSHQDVSKETQNYIDSLWLFGVWSTNDLNRSINEGWIFQLNYSEGSFDSVVTNRGTYFPQKEDCRNFHFYDVVRNELGGIVQVTDEQGHQLYSPPEQARKVSCDVISSDDVDCEVKGNWGTEEVNNASKTFNLENYWSFNYIVTTGPATITTTDYAGNSVTITVANGFAEGVTNPDDCKYLETKSITIDATGSKKVKVSYTW